MTKLTTERLEQYAHDKHMCNINDEIREMAQKLLEYEQAAKNPVAWVVGDEEIAEFKNGREVCVMRDCDDEQLDYLPLYAAPVLPKQPEQCEVSQKRLEVIGYGSVPASISEQRSMARALLSAQPVSEPYKFPQGYALVPCKLTAENGAKSCMIGKFIEQTEISCPECFGDDECETCDGSGTIEVTAHVSWTTIKDIWAKGIEHFAAAPAQESE